MSLLLRDATLLRGNGKQVYGFLDVFAIVRAVQTGQSHVHGSHDRGVRCRSCEAWTTTVGRPSRFEHAIALAVQMVLGLRTIDGGRCYGAFVMYVLTT